jgi:hypothetical protein
MQAKDLKYGDIFKIKSYGSTIYCYIGNHADYIYKDKYARARQLDQEHPNWSYICSCLLDEEVELVEDQQKYQYHNNINILGLENIDINSKELYCDTLNYHITQELFPITNKSFAKYKRIIKKCINSTPFYKKGFDTKNLNVDLSYQDNKLNIEFKPIVISPEKPKKVYKPISRLSLIG